MATAVEPEWTLGDRLRKAREVAGLSRDEMAAKLGITAASVWNWENGKSRPRDVLAVLYQWSAVTGVRVEWLIQAGSDNRPRPATHSYRYFNAPGDRILVGAVA